MAQVMVNFRLDEDVKKDMEQACREMGLSMTTAFTIFAKKVGKERRIPFEITAVSGPSGPLQRQDRRGETRQEPERSLLLARKQARLEQLCAAIRRSLTTIHTAIPASITGLSMERIRLLCSDELKDKAAGTSSAAKALFSSRNVEMLRQKDLGLLDEYIDGLSSISEELSGIEGTLIPAMRSWQGERASGFDAYEQRLAAVSQAFDALPLLMQRFLCSTACSSGVRTVRSRIRQAALLVGTPGVLAALDDLDTLILRYYDRLEERTKERLEDDYLQTLELTLWELVQAEREAEDVDGKTELCLRTIQVIAQIISHDRRARRELSGRRLEAEVMALERLAAMRGDISPESGP